MKKKQKFKIRNPTGFFFFFFKTFARRKTIAKKQTKKKRSLKWIERRYVFTLICLTSLPPVTFLYRKNKNKKKKWTYMQKNQVELRSRVSGWPGIGQASLERHHRQWWDDEARSLAWLSTSWRHARLMMSKQAWRFVLKKEQKHKRKRERDREREDKEERRES